jgi:hypothetical protein
MQIELQLVDIADGHNINAQAIRPKMSRIKMYALWKECLQYALRAIVILNTFIIPMLVFF